MGGSWKEMVQAQKDEVVDVMKETWRGTKSRDVWAELDFFLDERKGVGCLG